MGNIITLKDVNVTEVKKNIYLLQWREIPLKIYLLFLDMCADIQLIGGAKMTVNCQFFFFLREHGKLNRLT